MTFMTDITNLIWERSSNRVPFDPERQIKNDELLQILDAARWAPTAHNMQNFEIVVVDDRSTLKKLGDIRYPISEVFLRENLELLSFTREELLERKVGLLASTFPPEWLDPDRFREIVEDPPKPLNDVIDGSPTLLLVTFDSRRRAPDSEEDVLGMISLGCVMENMWLMAQHLGIGVRILSQFSHPGTEEEVKRALDIPDHIRIAFGLRLGYPFTKHVKGIRVRREVNQMAHRNRYGVRDL
jgi:nitroreductase